MPAVKKGESKKVIVASEESVVKPVLVAEDENIILKLNVKTQLESESLATPDPYNESVNEMAFYPIDDMSECSDLYSNIDMQIQSHQNVHVNKTQGFDDKSKNLKVVQLLKDFEEKNKNDEWPSTTSISCYWCCHSFSTPPFGVPVKYVHEKFHVYGCFCSLECAAAYNLDTCGIVDEVWERHQLIQVLSRRIGGPNIVKPAPSRLVLKMFGGYMDVEEFRDFCHTGKIININFPPMMTLTQQIEEINESELNNEFKYIPVDNDRINKFKLKLKRTKPITQSKNTLDNVVRIA